MKKSAILFVLAMVGMIAQTFAHALWIEAPFNASAGEKQTVKVFYGEYAHKELEKVNDWYSDVKEFKLILTAPDGTSAPLAATAHEDHFTAEFTPSQGGIYTLSIAHNPKFDGDELYQFNTVARVQVGKLTTGADKQPKQDITFQLVITEKYKVNKPINLATLLKSVPTEGIGIEIVSPSGWNTHITTDKDGKATFTPLWKGVYMIEASKYQSEQGTVNGVEHKNVWRCITYFVEVK